jgi:hypothetical protein
MQPRLDGTHHAEPETGSNLHQAVCVTMAGVRGLLSSDELPAWYDLLAEAFAAKGTPRDNFVARVQFDPHFELEHVRVYVSDDGSFQSTARLYPRCIHALNGLQLKVAGVGEVSTATSARRQGLAEIVLSDLVRESVRVGAVVSALHSSNTTYQGYYGRLGWRTIPMHMCTVPVSRAFFSESAAPATPKVELISLDDPHAQAWMARVHADAAPAGSFIRDEKLWRVWVPALARSQGCVTVRTPAAYGIFARSGDTLRVVEYLFSPGLQQAAIASDHAHAGSSSTLAQDQQEAFLALLQVAGTALGFGSAHTTARKDAHSEQACHEDGSSIGPDEGGVVSVWLQPACVPPAWLVAIARGDPILTTDKGFMFRVIDAAGLAASLGAPDERDENVLFDRFASFLTPDKFAFLPLDSF